MAHFLIHKQRVPDGLHWTALGEDGDAEEEAEKHHGPNAKPEKPLLPRRGNKRLSAVTELALLQGFGRMLDLPG